MWATPARRGGDAAASSLSASTLASPPPTSSVGEAAALRRRLESLERYLQGVPTADEYHALEAEVTMRKPCSRAHVPGDRLAPWGDGGGSRE
jgi:hypothetical protein